MNQQPSNQPPQTPPLSQTPQQSPKNKVSFWKSKDPAIVIARIVIYIFVGIPLLIFLLMILIYFLGIYNRRTNPTTTPSSIQSSSAKTSTPTGTSSNTEITNASWKTVTGCVQPIETSVKLNFQVDIPDNYQLTSQNQYGCGNAQYWEIPYWLTGGMSTVDIMATNNQSKLPDEQPDEGVWFQAPAPNSQYYISIHRNKPDIINGVSIAGISDEQWAHIKQSFSFK